MTTFLTFLIIICVYFVTYVLFDTLIDLVSDRHGEIVAIITIICMLVGLLCFLVLKMG